MKREVFAVVVACLFGVALSTSVTVAAVEVRDSACPTYVQLLPSLASYFNGQATTDDLAALATVCENNCMVELEADIQAYLSPNNEVLCGIDGAALSSLVDILAEFVCLKETEEEDSEYCVVSIQASMAAAGINLGDLDPDAVDIDQVCQAAAGAGCCTATYFEVLQGALTLACENDLAGYLGLVVSFCPLLSEYTVPDECEHFTVPDFVAPNPCPIKETNCTAVLDGCEDSLCQLLDCVPSIEGFSFDIATSTVNGAEILVNAVLTSLNRAADVSGICLAESYDTAYEYPTGSTGDGDDDITGNDANVVRGSIAAVVATALVSYFVL